MVASRNAGAHPFFDPSGSIRRRHRLRRTAPGVRLWSRSDAPADPRTRWCVFPCSPLGRSGWARAEPGQTRRAPAIGGIAHEVTERAHRRLIAAARRMGQWSCTRSSLTRSRGVGQPLPRPHPGVQTEAAHHPLSGRHGVLVQKSRPLLITPPVEHRSNALSASPVSDDSEVASHSPLDRLMQPFLCLVVNADSIIRCNRTRGCPRQRAKTASVNQSLLLSRTRQTCRTYA